MCVQMMCLFCLFLEAQEILSKKESQARIIQMRRKYYSENVRHSKIPKFSVEKRIELQSRINKIEHPVHIQHPERLHSNAKQIDYLQQFKRQRQKYSEKIR